MVKSEETDPEKLKKGIEWVSRVSDKNQNFATKAWLFYRLGDREQAKTFAQQAIETMKKESADYSKAEELLVLLEKE